MIRLATMEDLDALEAIERRCFPGKEFSRPLLRTLLTSEDSIVYVAVRASQLASSGMASIHGEVGTIDSVAVLPEYRRRGLGRSLMEVLEKECENRGVKRLRLEVGVDNEAAIHLYRRMGYRKGRTVSDHYGPGEDAVVMTKRLPPGA